MKGLYIAEIVGRETYNKPGITEDMQARMIGYDKGGNISTVHFLCIARPGLDFIIDTLEEDGKVYFKKHFCKFNGFNRSEYIEPKSTGITLPILETFYRKKIASIPGILIVKKEHLPLTKNSPNIDNFMENCIKYPKKYLEGF